MTEALSQGDQQAAMAAATFEQKGPATPRSDSQAIPVSLEAFFARPAPIGHTQARMGEAGFVAHKNGVLKRLFGLK